MSEHRVALNERDFRRLVAGEEVEQRTPSGEVVRIILSDIGYSRMMLAVMSANGRDKEEA